MAQAVFAVFYEVFCTQATISVSVQFVEAAKDHIKMFVREIFRHLSIQKAMNKQRRSTLIGFNWMNIKEL